MKYSIQNKNLIASSAEASIAEMICKDKRVGQSYFFQLFSSICYNKDRNTLQFISLRELWEYGPVMKRYLEYPDVQGDTLQNFFDEISIYTRRRDYVIHFVDGSQGGEDMNLLKDISVDNQRIKFLSWGPDGGAEETSLSYEEYSERYIYITSSKNRIRFDVYQPVIREERRAIDIEDLMKRLAAGKISVTDMIHCLSDIHKNSAFSLKVLNEWFLIFECTVRWLYDEGYLKCSTIIGEKDKKLFMAEVGQNNAMNLYQMLKAYNRLLQCLKKSILRS